MKHLSCIRARSIGLLLVLLPVLILFSGRVNAADFFVTNGNNAGAGSLRQAILDANSVTGPHTITFTYSGVVNITASLPTITRRVTIDGVNRATTILQGPGANNTVMMIVLGAGSGGSTIRNLTIRNTGVNGVQLTAAQTGITLENLLITQTGVHYLNRAVMAAAAQTNLTIRNVLVRGLEDGQNAFHFADKVNNLTMENVQVSNGGGGKAKAIHFQGVVTGALIKDCIFNMDDPATADDGDYGIYFAANHNGVEIDNTVFSNMEVVAIYAAAASTNFTLKNSTFNNNVGSGTAVHIKCEGNTNNVTIDNNTFNGDQANTADDANNAMLLSGVSNQHLTITNNKIFDYDFLGIRVGLNHTNNHDNVLIKGNEFARNGSNGQDQGALLFQARNTTSDGGPVLITENIFRNNTGTAIGIYPGNGVTYVVPNFTVSKNIIYGCTSTQGAIDIRWADKIVITQNSIYNNKGLGIDLSNDANCGYEGANKPQMISSVETSPGVYNVVVKMPTICGTNACSLELFANNANVTGVGGQHYVNTYTALGSGNRTLTGVTAAGIAAMNQAPFGFFSATMRLSNNCGTSEFSNRIGIKPTGPAGVSAGVQLWLKADNFNAGNLVAGTGWEDASGHNRNFSTLVGDPAAVSAGLNFNNYVNFDGNDYLYSPTYGFVTGFGAGEVLTVLRAGSNNVNRGYPYDFGGTPRGLHYTWSDQALYTSFGTNDRLGYIPSTKVVKDAKASTTITGENINVLNWNIMGTYGATGSWGLQFNGGQQSAISTANTVNFTLPGGREYIGYCGSTKYVYYGDIAETVLYSRKLSDVERRQVNTYLAIRSGLTLYHDYIAADGITVLWNRTTNNGYNNGIAGLYRDDLGIIHQRQSKTISMNDSLTISMGNSIYTANEDVETNIANDRAALIWGNNKLAPSYSVAVTGTNVTARMARVWKVQKTNWDDAQEITLKFIGATDKNYLLVSTDAGFTTVAHEVKMNKDGSVTIPSSYLANGAYFTLGRQQFYPGGVAAGLATWMKAGEDYTLNGTTVTQVVDQAPAQRTWTRLYNRALPWFNTGYNYNAYIRFPNNEHFSTPAFTTAFTAGEVFSVQASALVRDGSAVTTFSFPFQLGGVATSSAPPSYRNSNNTMWHSFGSATRVSFNIAPKDLGLPTILNLSSGDNTWSAGIDGRSIVNNAANTTNFTGASYIGAGGSAFFTGTLPEVIMYNRKLNAEEKQKIASYLAIKYGITLEQATAAQNYVSSDGTVIWTSADNAGYKENITAIGRDDVSALHQKQSRSANATTASFITFAVGESVMPSNEENIDSVENDKSYFFWSDNNGAVTYNTAVSGTEHANTRMARVWKVRKSNWQDITLTLKMHYGTSNVYLLTSTDPSFASVTGEYVINADSSVSLNSDVFEDGSYFTFAKEIKGPGMVTNGVQFWLRADDGTASGASWKDFSGNDNNAVQATAASQPVFNPSTVNFNPGLVLDGTNDYMDFATNAGISGTNQFTVVTVAKRASLNTVDMILGQQNANNNSFAFGYNSNNTFILTSTSVSSVTSSATYSTANIPRILAGTRAAGNQFNLYANGTADGAGTPAFSFLNANLRIGWRGGSSTDQFHGVVNEVVVYNRALTATEMQQVNSYLALKHGLTLAGGTQNYIATDGTTLMWTVAKNTGYTSGIAGLGRDEATGLHQKQSVSAEDPTITIALGQEIAPTNADNLNEIENLSFFTWASNGAATTFSVPVTTGNATVRMPRVWKVDRTNWTDQDITIKVGQNGDRYLLVNTADDPTFGTTGTTEYPINTLTGTVTINTADLPDGAFFTVATKIVGPACVNTNIAAWLRADYGAEATGTWSDFSGNQKSGTQGTTAAIPTVVDSSVNFNPAFRFNGTSQFFNIAPNVLNSGNNSYSIIAVTKPANLNERQVVFLGNSTANQGILLQYNNNNPGGGANTIEASWTSNPFYGGTTSLNKVDLLSSTYSTATGRALRQDGTEVSTNTVNNVFNYVPNTGLIGSSTGGLYYSGDMSEVIVYANSALTGAEMQRVESYLSLKYGITMAGGTVDYLASDGTTVMWNATDNAGYNYRITGIGRDDCTELYQKQSINSNGGILTLSVGEVASTNVLNTNTIDNDNSYLVFGDNNLPADYTVEMSGLNNLTAHMARIWKVDKTNWADRDITIKLKGGNDKIYLIVSTDNVFDGADAAYQLDADGNVSVLTADLPDGVYFTFAKELRGPGNVNVGINLWLRADDNVSTVDNWIDYSGNDNNAVQANTAMQPVYTTATTNYNPGFVFNGTSTNMSMTVSKFPTGTSARTLIAVGTPTNVTGTRYMFGWGSAAANSYNSLVNVAAVATYSGFTNDVSGGAGSAVINTPQELMGTYAGGTNALASLYNKSKLLLAQNKNWNTGTAAGAYVGMLSTSTQYWQGPLNEIATYNRALAAFERQRISSYLALKYGYTMDQTSPTSYVATDWDGATGTVYWDATANATHKNNIAGIGRDDKTGLNQKQSRSVNTAANGNMVAIGLSTIAATNEENTGSFGDDYTFLVWGDDGATGVKTDEYPESLDPGECSKITRLQREWKVQKTGTVDVLQLQIFLAGQVPTSTTLSDLKLLVNSSSDFSEASTTVIPASSYDATTQVVIFNNLSFEDGDYFTLVTDLTNEAPGGVITNLNAWYRADKGVTTQTGVSTWADQSPAPAVNVTQATAAAQPVYNTTTKLFNFNPSVTFDGTNDVLISTSFSHTAATNGEEVFTVLIPRAGDFLGFGRQAVGTQNFSRFYINGNGQLSWVSRVGASSDAMSAAGNTSGKIQLANMHRSSAGAGVIEYNGTTVLTGPQTYLPPQNQLNIGSRRYNDGSTISNDTYFNGEIAEVAIFNRELTANERQRVASYFGIKYGLTLGHDYLDPNGNVLWNATANTGYNNNITGIGRDDCNGLHQKQSRSVNEAEALITLGNGMGIATVNTDNANDMSNKSALILGDDNANRTTWVETNAPADRKRIARTWKIQETNTVGSVTIQAPASSSTATVKLPLEKAGKMYMLVSSSTDFTTGATEVAMTLNGDVWETSYDFSDGEYFTFATGGDCVDNIAVLTDYNAETAAAADKCYIDGWIYFKDPVDAGKYIAAIYDPTELIDRSKITVKVDVNSAFNDLGKGNSEKASRLMRRLLEVTCTDCYDKVANPQPSFTVRMFYSSTEKTGAENVETNNIEAIKLANGLTDPHTFTWFKAADRTAAEVVSSLSAETGIGATGQEWPDGSLVTGEIDGVEYVDFDGVNGFSTFGGIFSVNLTKVLPVSWGDVKAEPQGKKIVINWITHSEANNHHFVVERSEGNGVFVDIATVGGKGTTNLTNNYSVDDKNVKSGIVYQYRIRQVDVDGRSSYSKIVTAKLVGNNDRGLLIRPNPVVTGTLRFELTVQRSQPAQANVLDATGRVLGKATLRAANGWNQFNMSAAHLAKGTYMLQVILEDGTIISERFIKK